MISHRKTADFNKKINTIFFFFYDSRLIRLIVIGIWHHNELEIQFPRLNNSPANSRVVIHGLWIWWRHRERELGYPNNKPLLRPIYFFFFNPSLFHFFFSGLSLVRISIKINLWSRYSNFSIQCWRGKKKFARAFMLLLYFFFLYPPFRAELSLFLLHFFFLSLSFSSSSLCYLPSLFCSSSSCWLWF